MTADRDDHDDHGFGLVEVVVSMLILAALALAFLPLLIQGVKQSAQTATIATATQLVSTEIDAARSVTSCTLVPTNSTTTTDSRGVPLQIVRTRGTCPTSFPSTVSFTVTVTRTDTAAVMAKADTLILVTG